MPDLRLAAAISAAVALALGAALLRVMMRLGRRKPRIKVAVPRRHARMRRVYIRHDGETTHFEVE